MLLEMKNLCKSYGETIALDRLNLQLTPAFMDFLVQMVPEKVPL